MRISAPPTVGAKIVLLLVLLLVIGAGSITSTIKITSTPRIGTQGRSEIGPYLAIVSRRIALRAL